MANALASFYVEENAKIRVRQASAARLTRLNQELAQMQEVYTTQYPDVIRLKSEIAAKRTIQGKDYKNEQPDEECEQDHLNSL